jgi:endonuclease/exonuclease/phosphatase family metal-dependent hydrolase
LEFLADSVWTHHAYGKNAIYQKGHHGNAILSAYPFSAWDNIDVSVVNFSKRGMLHGVTSQGIHLLCTHLGLFERERRLQISKLNSYMREKIPVDEPLILAGDFNDWRKTSHRFLLDQLGLQEAVELGRNKLAKTFPAIFPVLAMDRIYIRGFKVSGCRVMNSSKWRSLSDHCAVLADLTLTVSPQAELTSLTPL